MPNVFKSGSTSTNGSIYKGQFTVGVNTNVDFGPTSATSFWNGVIPSSGGYTIYQNKAANGPSIRTAANDSSLVSILQSMGSTGSTAANVLDWASQQSNIMVANIDYPSIVTSGMVLSYDAGYVSSYPTTANLWRDLSVSNITGNLTNGPTFSSVSGGSITFDGTNDYVDCGNISSIINTTTITFSVWLKLAATGVNKCILGNEPYYSNGILVNPVGFGLRQRTNNSYQLSLGTNTFPPIEYVPVITTTNWHNVSVTTDGTTARMYINGGFVKSGGCTNTIGSTVSFVLGRVQTPTPAEYWGGNMAAFQLYNRTLSATEVLQNYNALKSRFGL